MAIAGFVHVYYIQFGVCMCVCSPACALTIGRTKTYFIVTKHDVDGVSGGSSLSLSQAVIKVGTKATNTARLGLSFSSVSRSLCMCVYVSFSFQAAFVFI